MQISSKFVHQIFNEFNKNSLSDLLAYLTGFFQLNWLYNVR
jgi:hypothetical protein